MHSAERCTLLKSLPITMHNRLMYMYADPMAYDMSDWFGILLTQEGSKKQEIQKNIAKLLCLGCILFNSALCLFRFYVPVNKLLTIGFKTILWFTQVSSAGVIFGTFRIHVCETQRVVVLFVYRHLLICSILSSMFTIMSPLLFSIAFF